MEKSQSFLSEIFQFLEVKFSIYLNRRVFVMQHMFLWKYKKNINNFWLKKAPYLEWCLKAWKSHLLFPTNFTDLMYLLTSSVKMQDPLSRRSKTHSWSYFRLCWRITNNCFRSSCKYIHLYSLSRFSENEAERQWILYISTNHLSLNVRQYTVITLSIGTPYLLTILHLKFESSFNYLLMYLNYCCMYGKQCRPWSDAPFFSIWSGSTLFAKVDMSQYLGLLQFYLFVLRLYDPVNPIGLLLYLLTCALNKDANKPMHSCSLIRVSIWRKFASLAIQNTLCKCAVWSESLHSTHVQRYIFWHLAHLYGEPLFQRQHLFSKMLPL